MASAFFRGPKATPRWFARYKSAGGAWKAKRVRVETRTDALRIARKLEGQAERRRYGLEGPEGADERVGVLLGRWCDALTNRAASDDRSRVRLHVAPRFGSMRLADVTLAALMGWLDDGARTGTPSAPTLRHCLGILSRFFGWCVARGLAQANPVRAIPQGRRPRSSAPRADAVPWLDDDETVRRLMAALPEAISLMFYVANRSGLRTGEVCGLRLSDVDDLVAGAIRVRHSYGGPLKEDKAGGKVKWVPSPEDAAEMLEGWLARRRAEGAGPEAYLFPRGATHYRKEHVHHAWRKATNAVGVTLTWYQATRHSFASRCLSRGAPLDQVSSALGHATPSITARHYAHFVRKVFSPLLTAGLSAAPAAPVSLRAEAGGARAPRNPEGAIPPTSARHGQAGPGRARLGTARLGEAGRGKGRVPGISVSGTLRFSGVRSGSDAGVRVPRDEQIAVVRDGPIEGVRSGSDDEIRSPRGVPIEGVRGPRSPHPEPPRKGQGMTNGEQGVGHAS